MDRDYFSGYTVRLVTVRQARTNAVTYLGAHIWGQNTTRIFDPKVNRYLGISYVMRYNLASLAIKFTYQNIGTLNKAQSWWVHGVTSVIEE